MPVPDPNPGATDATAAASRAPKRTGRLLLLIGAFATLGAVALAILTQSQDSRESTQQLTAAPEASLAPDEQITPQSLTSEEQPKIVPGPEESSQAVKPMGTPGSRRPASPGQKATGQGSESGVMKPTKGSDESDLAAKLIGHWLLNDSIRRDLTIRSDGTASMHVDLDLVSSFFYGSKMDLELTWKVHDGTLTHTLVQGVPKENVDKLIHDFGNSRSYKIVKLTKSEMVLQDLADDKAIHHWVAVEVE